MQRTLSIVNLRAVRGNALKIKKLAGGANFYAVVKADAYGHGAEEVSRYIEDVADGFCVAITEEGIALRVAGVSQPVLVLTPPLDGYDVSRARAYNLTLTVNSVNTAALVGGAPCHIKVNTGMNRLGCDIHTLPDILKALPRESVLGVYSHLYAPDDVAASASQLEIFRHAERMVKAVNPQAVAHISASGGLLRGGKYLADGVRCGILLYGYAPSGFKADGFERALRVYARRTQTTRFIGGLQPRRQGLRRFMRVQMRLCGRVFPYSAARRKDALHGFLRVGRRRRVGLRDGRRGRIRVKMRHNFLRGSYRRYAP